VPRLPKTYPEKKNPGPRSSAEGAIARNRRGRARPMFLLLSIIGRSEPSGRGLLLDQKWLMLGTSSRAGTELRSSPLLV